MSNPLFNALGGGMSQGNGPMQMIQQFMQFRQNFKGDPKAEVEKMLQSGKISQQQLNQVQQMAGQFQHMTQKQSYRSGKSEDCKRKMLAALEEHLDELTTEMSDMSKDAECREERDLVKRYVEKLRDML